MKLLFCNCCNHMPFVSSVASWICISAILITILILLYLVIRIWIVPIRKLKVEDEMKAREFQRRKELEEFLRDMDKAKDSSIAAARDDERIKHNSESAISYAKSLILLAELMRATKPITASAIKEGKENVESFMEMVKSLSNDDMLNNMLNHK